ncbi:unnamed protein product [Orchesella dallaii]|uniref:Uncharacterized protein n=1 Tax=Orchesella dallaii TaxID=48710 RepID=A0ABP1RPK7_9HEXA
MILVWVLIIMYISSAVSCLRRNDPNDQFPRLIFDITAPLNSILEDKFLSTTDFLSNSDFGELLQRSRAENLDPILLFNTGCTLFNVSTCKERIENAVNIIDETFGKNGSLGLILSLNLNPIIEQDANESAEPFNLPNFPIHILLNLELGFQCEALNSVNETELIKVEHLQNWINLEDQNKLGFGYTKDIFDCNDNYAIRHLIFSLSEFLVLNINFGYTVGVIESFGLFQHRMNNFHMENVKFIKKMFNIGVNTMPEPYYYPNAELVGDENYRRLLYQFADKWAKNGIGLNQQGMIIQAPYFSNAPELKELRVTPYVQPLECDSDNKNIKTKHFLWYAPSALATISKKFNTVILTLGKKNRNFVDVKCG